MSIKEIDVLLADDNVDHNCLQTKMLADLGYRFTIVEDGQTAYALAIAKPFDLIILDLQLPLMDGYEVTRRLRFFGYQGPIVMISAHAFDHYHDAARAAGVTAYLTKPLDFPSLRRQLAALLPQTVCVPCPVQRAEL